MDFLTRHPSKAFRSRKDSPRRQSGVASVEMVVVLPVLLLLLFGIIEFGFIFREQMVLFRAADLAARTAILVDETCNNGALLNEAITAGEDMLAHAGVDGGDVQRDSTSCMPCERGTITMTASSTYHTQVLGAFVPSLATLDLSASSMQRTFH
jgi:Flp pilus assembly protein TadG